MEWRSRYNGTWVLFKNSTLEIYTTLKHGLYYIYQIVSKNGSKSESLWNKDGYLNINPLWINNNDNESPGVYYLLENYLGDVCIMEIVSKKIVLFNFDVSDYRSCAYINNNKKGFDIKIEDTIVGLLFKDKKSFALVSLKNGYVFGPYNYTIIEEYKYGVILDNKTIVENNGAITDISGYVKHGRVICNEDKTDCLFILDEESQFIILLRQNQRKHNKFEASYKNRLYSFDIRTSELENIDLSTPEPPNRDIEEWTIADSYYAYEGHSELELGID